MTTSMGIKMMAWRVGGTSGFQPLCDCTAPAHMASAVSVCYDTILGSKGGEVQRRGPKHLCELTVQWGKVKQNRNELKNEAKEPYKGVSLVPNESHRQ